MRLALCQIDSRVADVPGNLRRVMAAVEVARAEGAHVAVLPEMILSGYPPRDLLYRPELVAAVEQGIAEVAARARGIEVVLGAVEAASPPAHRNGRPLLRNVAVVTAGGAVQARRAKTLLPCYDVFDEPRWFVPAEARALVQLGGRRAGLLICEDMWDEGYPVSPPRELAAAGAQLLVAISASPYRHGIAAERLRHARRHGAPLVYVNAIGAEDELIFDGGSFAIAADGRLLAQLPRFEERIEVVDLSAAEPGPLAPDLDPAEEVFRALALGVRDFCGKNGLRHAVLGLSGGVDSALVACVAKEALGARAVTAVALPSRFNDPRSTEDARALAQRLGIGFEVIPIAAMHAAAEATLAPLIAGDEGGRAAVAENVQARLRAVVLMAFVNRHGGILLNTSNKTEAALGYGTLYGDMAGGLAVIGDLSKTWVYRLARWYDGAQGGGVIPAYTLERAPSAELKPDQVDPFDYPRISPFVDALIEGASRADLFAMGARPDEVDDLERRIRLAEHKRRQSPIVLKVMPTSFGCGRLVPVTNGIAALGR